MLSHRLCLEVPIDSFFFFFIFSCVFFYFRHLTFPSFSQCNLSGFKAWQIGFWCAVIKIYWINAVIVCKLNSKSIEYNSRERKKRTPFIDRFLIHVVMSTFFFLLLHLPIACVVVWLYIDNFFFLYTQMEIDDEPEIVI